MGGGEREKGPFFFPASPHLSEQRPPPQPTRMAQQYPLAIYDLDADEQTIRDLVFACNTHSDTSVWISPQNHRGTLTLHSKTHPLSMNYVADDRNSVLVKLDDPVLKSVLEFVEAAVKAVAPDADKTNDLINRDASGKYADSLKLKTAYTQFVCAETNERLTAAEALSSRRNRICSWVLQVYRLNFFRGTWYFSVMLKSAKVSRAAGSPDQGAGKRKRDDDFTQYL